MSKTPPQGEIILYQTEDGLARVECRFVDESIWLSQRLIGELYQVSIPTVNEHLSNIYAEGELSPEATIRKFRIVQREGTREVTRAIDHYSLNAILAVGYRVRSPRGTAFRQSKSRGKKGSSSGQETKKRGKENLQAVMHGYVEDFAPLTDFFQVALEAALQAQR